MAQVAITHEVYDDASFAVATFQDLDTLVATAAPGDALIQFENDGNTWVFLRATDAATVTAVLEGQRSPEGPAVADVTLTIPIGATTPQFAVFPPMNPKLFNGAGGLCQITLESVAKAANVKYALVRVKRRG